MAKRFPKTLFIKIGSGTGPDWFEAQENITGMVEVGETTRIAVYTLSHINDAEGLVKIHPPRRRSK